MKGNEENNLSSHYLIVIGRQYGSGGRSLAQSLSNKLAIPVYDKSLLGKAAKKYGFSEQIFSNADERKPSLLRSMLSHAYGVQENYGSHTLSAEKIYEAQSNVIRALCNKEDCIIVGRTADYVMRDHPNMLSIFIHSSQESRAERIFKRGETSSKEEALSVVIKRDKERKRYYDYFTGREWGRADNYDICIDSSLLDEEEISELISYIVSKRKLNTH